MHKKYRCKCGAEIFSNGKCAKCFIEEIDKARNEDRLIINKLKEALLRIKEMYTPWSNDLLMEAKRIASKALEE